MVVYSGCRRFVRIYQIFNDIDNAILVEIGITIINHCVFRAMEFVHSRVVLASAVTFNTIDTESGVLVRSLLAENESAAQAALAELRHRVPGRLFSVAAVDVGAGKKYGIMAARRLPQSFGHQHFQNRIP